MRCYSPARENSRTSPWGAGFVEIRRAPSIWWVLRVSRWSFLGVARARGDRGGPGFSDWFTYEWVARVSWQGKERGFGELIGGRPRGGVLRPKMSGFWMPAGPRVITLRERRIFPLYESLLSEKEEYFHSTSHYSSRGELPALRIIIFQARKSLLYESLLFGGRNSCPTT